MTEVTPNLPHFGSFCKYCFMGTLLGERPIVHRLHRHQGRIRHIPEQRAELDWLLYNKPLEYAQMVLSGEIGHYLSLGCDHGRLEDP